MLFSKAIYYLTFIATYLIINLDFMFLTIKSSLQKKYRIITDV